MWLPLESSDMLVMVLGLAGPEVKPPGAADGHFSMVTFELGPGMQAVMFSQPLAQPLARESKMYSKMPDNGMGNPLFPPPLPKPYLFCLTHYKSEAKVCYEEDF